MPLLPLLLFVGLVPAQDVVIRDDLHASSTATTVYGGTFTGTGWRVDDASSRLFWDLGTQVERGSVSVVIDDVTLENLQGDNNHLIELFDEGGHWSCHRAVNFRVYGPADAASHGDVKLKVWDDQGHGAEARGGIQDWDGGPHTWTLRWDLATAVLARDGLDLVTLDVTGFDLRVGTLWLPLNDWAHGYGAPIGMVYSSLALDGWEPEDQVDTGEDTGPGSGGGLTPTDDVGVLASLPDTVYADLADLPVEGDGAAPTEVSYLAFNLSHFEGRVTAATLRLHVRDGGSSGGSAGAVWAVADTAWSEESLTWNTRPALGERLDGYGATSPGDVVELDVRAGVRAGGRVALALASEGDDGVHFASREVGNGMAPRLVVELEPLDGDSGQDSGPVDPGDSDGGGEDSGAGPGDHVRDDVPRGCGCSSGPVGAVAALGVALALGAGILGRRRPRR